MGFRLKPMIGGGMLPGIAFHIDQLPIADGSKLIAHRRDHLAGSLIIGKIVAGKPKMAIIRFSLGPSLPLPSRIPAVGLDEVEPLLGGGNRVGDNHGESIAEPIRFIQLDEERFSKRMEFQLFAPEADTPHLELSGIKPELVEEGTERNKFHGHLTGACLLFRVYGDCEAVMENMIGSIPGNMDGTLAAVGERNQEDK